jgi:hypothetical protein
VFRIRTFSDDIPWAKENFRLPHEMTFVDVNTSSSVHDDLRLMSACKHHVIANNTFSRWGAWLDPRPDELVVAPRYWGCTPDSSFPELFPANRVCVDNLR